MYKRQTYGRFTVSTHGQDGLLFMSKIHFTFVWQNDKDGLFLLHANACHVQDGQEQQMEENQARIFDHVPAEVFTQEKIKKIRIKDLDGNVHFLFQKKSSISEVIIKMLLVSINTEALFPELL